MFFRKIINSHHVSNQHINKDKSPVCIIGSGALACFLAAKLQDAEENVVIISSEKNLHAITDKDITIKEEYNLQKKTYRFNTSFVVPAQASVIIFASDSHTLNAHLSFLPGKNMAEIPLISFNQLHDKKFIIPLLGNKYSFAYFHGYLDFKDTTITVYNLLPQISISKEMEENKDKIDILLSKINLPITYNSDDKTNFWKYFSVNALGFLYSQQGKNIAEILKNKDTKENIRNAANEITLLARHAECKLSEEELIKTLYELPASYQFKKQISSAADLSSLDYISEILNTISRKNHCKIPVLNALIKYNYQTLLKK